MLQRINLKTLLATIVVFLLLTILLSGCSMLDARIADAALNESGIFDDKDYLDYQKYVSSGKLDDNDYYLIDDEILKIDTTKQIHVSFASNSFLKMAYYTDKDCTNVIPYDEYYIDPGESLYATVANVNNSISNKYRFVELQIREFDKNGAVNKSGIVPAINDDNITITFPENYKGTDVTIIPVGEYEKRDLKLHDFCYDGKGDKQELSSRWIVNDQTTYGESIQINAVSDYSVSCEYDPKVYYVEKTNPDYYSLDEVNGIINYYYSKANADNSQDDFEVELHQLITISIDDGLSNIQDLFTGELIEIYVNDKKCEIVDNSIVNIKCGDRIVAQTGSKYRPFFACGYDVRFDSPEPTQDGYKHVVIIPETNENAFQIVISKWDYGKPEHRITLNSDDEHGKCVFSIDGRVCDGETVFYEGQKLELEYEIGSNDYKIERNSQGWLKIKDFALNLISSKKASVSIELTADMEDRVLSRSDFISVVKKGS